MDYVTFRSKCIGDTEELKETSMNQRAAVESVTALQNANVLSDNMYRITASNMAFI